MHENIGILEKNLHEVGLHENFPLLSLSFGFSIFYCVPSKGYNRNFPTLYIPVGLQVPCDSNPVFFSILMFRESCLPKEALYCWTLSLYSKVVLRASIVNGCWWIVWWGGGKREMGNKFINNLDKRTKKFYGTISGLYIGVKEIGEPLCWYLIPTPFGHIESIVSDF